VSHIGRVRRDALVRGRDKSLGRRTETPEYPGQRFQIRCADLATALDALLRADARMLEGLAWRGTEGSATLARWRPEQEMEITARQVMRRNPWSGMAGCIYLGRHEEPTTVVGNVAAPTHFVAGARSAQRRLCGMPPMSAGQPGGGRRAAEPCRRPGLADPVDDTRWMVPPSLYAMSAAARVAAPAFRFAVPPVHRCRCRLARSARRPIAMARIASCSTARRSTSVSPST
jgi:hypothetical protein